MKMTPTHLEIPGEETIREYTKAYLTNQDSSITFGCSYYIEGKGSKVLLGLQAPTAME